MNALTAYLWVALGGALGSMARYGASIAATRVWGPEYPWGTILINVVGSFAISFFGTLTAATGPVPASQSLRTFVMVGICGGFTTFSSFSLQTFELARSEQWLGAMSNVLLSVMLCLASVTAGHALAALLATVARTEP